MNDPPTFCANSAYHQSNKKTLATFLHAAAGYTPNKTFYKAIDDGLYASWPGLTSKLIRKHLQKSIPTVMGRQKRMRQGIRSTSKKEEPPAIPFLQRGTPTNEDYQKLEETLKNTTTDKSPRVSKDPETESLRVPEDPEQDPPRMQPNHARPEFAPGTTR